MNALEIRGLSKAYDRFKLDDFNLELPMGCVMGLVGENGAGKSTVIKLILDMIKRDEGTVSILGRDNKKDLHLTKEDIGVVLDEVGIPGGMKTGQLDRIMGRIYKNWDSAGFAKCLDMLSVPRDKQFKDLSKGNKMKLGIAIAMSHGAKLLILDEATSGLDPVVRDEVLDMFMEFTRDEGHSILISSHIVSDLEKLCDYIAFLHEGKLLLCEEKDALRERYGLLRCRAEDLKELPEGAVLGKRESAYGVEAMVRRELAPADMDLGPIDIEQIFIFMVKGDR